MITQAQKLISTLSLAHAQRMDELIGVGPLASKPIDVWLLNIGLVEWYDGGGEAVQLTKKGIDIFEQLNWVALLGQKAKFADQFSVGSPHGCPE